MREAAGSDLQPEKIKTRRLRETGTEIVFGTDMAIKRENAIEIKIVERETANEIGIGIGIDIAGMTEKSGTPSLAILLPVLSHQGLITVVYLLALMLRGTEKFQITMRPLGKEEDLLTMR